MDNWDKPFLKGVLRESDGTPSLSRTGTFIALIAAIFWVTSIVMTYKQIPPLSEPVNWVVGISLAFYGVNTASKTIRSFANKTKSDDEPTP